MRIKRLHIKNGYKRFHNLTIDLGDDPKRIIALVGPNGCGKSSVFDALMFRTNAFSQAGDRSTAKDYFYHSMKDKDSVDHNDIKIDFLGGEFFEILTQNGTAGHRNTIFSFRSPYRYNSNVKISNTQAVGDIKLNDYGASNCAVIDEKMEQNYRRLNAFYRAKMEREDLPPSRAKEIVIGELNQSIKNCLDLEIDNLGNVEGGEGTLYFKKPNQPEPFEFNVLSSGEKEVVDILLDLFLRKENYNDSVFLIDEPELHINTSIQRNLLREINKLIGENCQIWISTHSIGFLRALQTDLVDECAVIEFKKDVDYASKPQILSPMKPNLHSWKRLFEVPLDDLSNLICPEKIIYCEGRDSPTGTGQEQGFDAKFYNIVFGEKYPNTLFVSSGGNTELDQRSNFAISILGKAIQNLEVLVLKDRDVGSGKDTSDADRQEYIDNNEKHHRMLKRVELENYAFDKEVVRAYCVDKNIEFDEVTYDQHLPDIRNGDVKDKVNIIKNICGINVSISPEKFKLNLADYIKDNMDVYKELESCIFLNN